MNNVEIYKAFVSKLENRVSEDAKGLLKWEKRARENNDDAQRIRMVNDARFYGKREHETMVRHYNDVISVLAEILEQKSIKLRPKYCPK